MMKAEQTSQGIAFAGVLTVHDAKRHLPHAFVVPPGSARLAIRLTAGPTPAQGLDHMLTLTLFDPHGFRGARHRGGAQHDLFITDDAATPGYLPGPLPPGEWVVQLDTHRIVPGIPVRYTIEITIESGATPAQTRLSPGAPGTVARPDAGWYRGDLHSHTTHSDAGERTVAELIEHAREVGLEFLFLTDHNTIAPLAEIDAAASPTLLTAGGMELTTFWGHVLVLGTRQWIDWRLHPGDDNINHLANDVYANNQLFIMAHPCSGGDPSCTGCAWRFGEMMPGAARLIEVWNGVWAGDSNNEQALALFYDWLNQGRRLVATAGSDTHQRADYAAGPGFNVVFAEALTEAALLRAIAAGHLYLSSGPELILEAHTADGAQHWMGDTVTQPAAVTVRWQACPAGTTLHVRVNGQELHRQPAAGEDHFTCSIGPGDADWLVAELRRADGVLLALTNPLFWATDAAL